MNINPVILAIPIYFFLMGIEILYEHYTRKKTYRINDAVTNISTGTLQQLTNTFIILFKVGIYTWVYNHWALTEIQQNWKSFIIAMILWDFFYYWEHRMAHSINLFWGGHIVHHQSEDFNLSVALRQTSTGFIWGFPFYLPMAIMGIHPIQFVIVGGFNLLYQFWIHTEHIKKLPASFEWIFNTPSHHRVHHGRDPKYIDKNFAGILIIWDRLFSTFQIEEEKPSYGITTPLNSWNPVYANFSHYIYIMKVLRKVRGIGDGIKLLFLKPGWLPNYLGGQQNVNIVESNYTKYDAKIPQVQIYVLFQFLLAAALNAYYFFNANDLYIVDKYLFASFIILSTIVFGLLFEQKHILIYCSELLRIGFGLFLFFKIINGIYDNIPLVILYLSLVLISIIWLFRIYFSKK